MRINYSSIAFKQFEYGLTSAKSAKRHILENVNNITSASTHTHNYESAQRTERIKEKPMDEDQVEYTSHKKNESGKKILDFHNPYKSPSLIINS